MAKSKYKQFKDGQEIEVEPGVGLNFACCDCALVHDLQVRLENGKVFVSFTRDNRKTAALRRHYVTPMQPRRCEFPDCEDIGWNGGYCRLHEPRIDA